MKKLLFVSISFPPKSDPEALQTAKYFHYLQQFKDLRIDVVTSAVPTLYSPYDKTLEPYSVGVRQLIEISLKENRYINFIRSRLGLQETVFPDSKQSFHKQYMKVLKQLKEKPDLIYSRADPKSSTIMAYKLKRALNVPWILHMSDPWADCPFHVMSRQFYRKNDEWEKKCFVAADIISLTSIPTIDFYKKKYPEFSEKFRFYPNVYEYLPEPEENFEPIIRNSRKLRIVHTGGLADTRSPEFLLKPLQELYEQDPSLYDKLEVIFAGEMDARNRAVFSRYDLPFVKWLGRVPFKEALQLQRSADYLVAIDFPVDDPEMAMFFLSKLLDYMVSRKRILTLTTAGSASDMAMRDLKSDVCSRNDVGSIKKAILAALSAFERGDKEYLVNERPPEKYEASYNANRLYQEIVELTSV